MSDIRDRTFAGNEPVEVDGKKFVNCKFDSASLRYAGGEHPNFEGCTFGDIGWHFSGPALRTIQLLQAQNVEGGAAAMITEIFTPGNYLAE